MMQSHHVLDNHNASSPLHHSLHFLVHHQQLFQYVALSSRPQTPRPFKAHLPAMPPHCSTNPVPASSTIISLQHLDPALPGLSHSVTVSCYHEAKSALAHRYQIPPRKMYPLRSLCRTYSPSWYNSPASRPRMARSPCRRRRLPGALRRAGYRCPEKVRHGPHLDRARALG